MDMKSLKDFPPNKFLVVLGKMESAIMSRVEKHIKDMGFNSTEFLIMYAIAEHGPLTIQDIAARIFVTSGNMTYTIDKMAKKGVLKRVACPEDRRRTYIDFTDQGRLLWDRLLDDHQVFLEELFAPIDDALLISTIEQMKMIGKGI